MVSGVLSASRIPAHSTSRYEVMDFNVSESVRLKARLSEPPKFSNLLDSGKLPLFAYGPAACKSFAQRGSSSIGTGPEVGKITPGHPASWLATRGNVAASVMAAKTRGLPFS